MHSFAFSIPVKTTNPNNGSQSTTRGGQFARARRKHEQRELARLTLAHAGPRLRALLAAEGAVSVTLTRFAPSAGLDPDDNLPASQKWIKDGIAEILGLKNDRDPRVKWHYGQKRSKRGDYATGVVITFEKGEEL